MSVVAELRTLLHRKGVFSSGEMDRIGITLAIGDVPRPRENLARRYIVSKDDAILLSVKFIPGGSGFPAEDILRTRTRYADLDFFRVPDLVAHFPTAEGHFFIEEHLRSSIALGKLVEQGTLSGHQAADVTRRILGQIWSTGEPASEGFIRTEKENYRTYLQTFIADIEAAFLRNVILEDLERIVDDHAVGLKRVWSAGDIIDKNILLSNGHWYLIDFEYSHPTLFFFKEAYRNLLYCPWARTLTLSQLFPWIGDFPEDIAQVLSLAWEKHLHSEVLDKHSNQMSRQYLRRLFWKRLDPQEEVQIDQLRRVVQAQEQALEEKEQSIVRLHGAVRQEEDRRNETHVALIQKEAQLHRLSEALAQKDTQLTTSREALRQRETHTRNLQDVLRRKDARITELRSALADKDTQIAALGEILVRKDAQVTELSEMLVRKDAQITELGEILDRKDAHLTDQSAMMGRYLSYARRLGLRLSQKKAQLARLQSMLSRHENQFRDLSAASDQKDHRIDQLNGLVSDQEGRLHDLQGRVQAQEAMLSCIYQSHGWSLLTAYYKWRDTWLPMDSRRRTAARLAFNAVLKPREVLKNITAQNLRDLFYYYRHAHPSSFVHRVEGKLLNQPPAEPPPGPSGRDLSGIFQRLSLGRFPRRPVEVCALSAVECIDKMTGKTNSRLMKNIPVERQVSDVTKAYLVRIFEATARTFRNRHLFPTSAVEADIRLLQKDYLSLLFLYYLFSFRDVRLSLRHAPAGGDVAPLRVVDDQVGTFDVQGDNSQTLTFTRAGGQVVRCQIGAVLRHPSFEFLTDPFDHAPANVVPIAPSFSVIIPVYDRTIDLIEAVGSVLNQDYPWCELVFVFNGSPRQTLQLIPDIRALLKARRYRQKIIILPRPYGSANIPRNIGCYGSTGDYLLFLDSDDYMPPPDFLSRLAEVVRSAPEDCSIFYPATVEFVNIDRDHPIRKHLLAARPPVCNWDVLYRQGNVLNNSGVCVRRKTFFEVGGMNPAMEYCEDYELFLRLVGRHRYGLPFDARVRIKLHKQNNEIRFEPEKAAWMDRARRSAESFLAGHHF